MGRRIPSSNGHLYSVLDWAAPKRTAPVAGSCPHSNGFTAFTLQFHVMMLLSIFPPSPPIHYYLRQFKWTLGHTSNNLPTFWLFRRRENVLRILKTTNVFSSLIFLSTFPIALISIAIFLHVLFTFAYFNRCVTLPPSFFLTNLNSTSSAIVNHEITHTHPHTQFPLSSQRNSPNYFEISLSK